MTAAAMGTAEMAARDQVREAVQRAHSSFYWGMRILPPERREAMFAIYAFCREVDDIADGPGGAAEKRAALAAWREEIAAVYAGTPGHPIAQALVEPVRRFDLPREEFLAVIDGMETDAQAAIHGMSMDELKLYCRRVAGAVGLLSVRVFGDASPRALQLAVLQGEALQLTNILRDLAEDAARDRLYLPHELLDKYGIDFRQPALVLAHPALHQVCSELASVARNRYRVVRALAPDCDRAAMRPALLMLAMYAAILDRLQVRGWDRPQVRVRLPVWQKLWIALRHGFL